MVEDVVGVGLRIFVTDNTGVFRFSLLIHVATHREPCRAVVHLVFYLKTVKSPLVSF